MKVRTSSFLAIVAFFLVAGQFACSSEFALPVTATPGGFAGRASAAVDPDDNSPYAEGTRAINEGRWSDAVAIFTKIAGQKGEYAEGALYWKAYAENKQGQFARALGTCGDLRRAYPKSKWIDECGALEIEIRGRNGDARQYQGQPDEDLKLLALNSLMQQDEARALPAIQQILNGNSSDRLKERALFVLAQSSSKQAQDLLGQIARGQTNPVLQVKAIQMYAAAQGKQSAAALAEIYRHSSDDRVKKAVLNAYLISDNPDRLVEAARHESNPDLARAAVQALGALGGSDQMLALYRETNSHEIKEDIISGLIAAGTKGAAALSTIAANEQDADLRDKAIRNLGIAGGEPMAPSLVAIYQKNSDPQTKKAAIEALFLAGDAHDLITLARAEKDAGMKQAIVQRLSVMQNKEATDYMLELLK